MTTQDEQVLEAAKCYRSASYFISRYCRIYDATARDWIPFGLWPAQKSTLATITNNLLVVVLKARQLGLTWLVLAYALWTAIFRPAATILLFSRRDDEAMYLLGDERLKGMFNRLPGWLKPAVTEDSRHIWGLANGSVVRAFPTNAGDSYTATLAIVDEADLVPDLGRMLNAVKPTIDGGGRLILLSRVDKSQPESEFKRIYQAAKRGENGWAHVFLPWHARPSRDAEWYEAQRRDVLSRTGALDDLYQQYPASDAEALAPATLDKRIAPAWLLQCYEEMEPIESARGMPAIPGLAVYKPPLSIYRYIVGVDPAEGNPTSDDSALHVLCRETGEEVAALAGKFQPATTAAHGMALADWYNSAPILVERNNHGHAVLLWLQERGRGPMAGWDGKAGWLSTSRGKALLYDYASVAFRDQDTRLHSFETYTQLSSIEGATLKAPEGRHDDRAVSYALCLAGIAMLGRMPSALPEIESVIG